MAAFLCLRRMGLQAAPIRAMFTTIQRCGTSLAQPLEPPQTTTIPYFSWKYSMESFKATVLVLEHGRQSAHHFLIC